MRVARISGRVVADGDLVAAAGARIPGAAGVPALALGVAGVSAVALARWISGHTAAVHGREQDSDGWDRDPRQKTHAHARPSPADRPYFDCCWTEADRPGALSVFPQTARLG